MRALFFHGRVSWVAGVQIFLPYVCSAMASVKTVNTLVSKIPLTRKDTPIPITVLAGFLGSGKTTLLQNLLNNSEGLRIAVIVNDVASVNIDSKLVRNNMNAAAGMVELQNGCACCAKSEELLSSVAELVTLSDMRGDDEGFHHIVVEMSGVADPKSVRSKFQEATLYDMPLLDRVRLDTMVTLVDCSTFLDYLKSSKAANPIDAPELFYRDGEEPPDEFDGIPLSLLEKLGVARAKEADSGVAELIVSQTETADIVLLNKVDLVDDAVLSEIGEIVQALNPRARVIRTKYGQIALKRVLGAAQGSGVVQAGVVDDHKDAVHAVSCHDPACTDPSHSHDDHEHKEAAGTSSSHSHDHARDSAVYTDASSCEDPDCSDTSHSHSHEHACDDPDCSDPSHSHSDGTHAGIGAFVYRARRPFHPGRLLDFLRYLPLKRGLPENCENESAITVTDSGKKLLSRVLRSKGFTWCANSHLSALYWSHAGTSFELSCLGSWWATLPREQWPLEAVSAILQDFDDGEHDEQDARLTSVGDRRQEIVFIGPTLGDSLNQEVISRVLNQCLLQDSEWPAYADTCSNEAALASAFPSKIIAKYVSY